MGLLYFILGIIFSIVGVTILQKLSAAISNLGELFEKKLAVKYAEYEARIENIMQQKQDKKIGFQPEIKDG